MGVFLGLAAALGWGVADFMARFATRRTGALRALFFMQIAGLIALTIAMLAMGHWSRFFPPFRWQPWAWLILAGGISALSALALYRSFEIGVLALVSPIAASYPALTVALAFESGERLTRTHAAGIGVAIVGVILAALVFSPQAGNPTNAAQPAGEKHLLRGVPWALAAALGFGVNYWILGFRVMPVFGGFASVWVIRLTTLIVLALFFAPLRQSAALPRGSLFWLIFFIGLADTGGFLANNFAFKTEQISIATVLASLYGMVTMLLAAVFLRERLERRQWAGIALIFIGVALVSV